MLLLLNMRLLPDLPRLLRIPVELIPSITLQRLRSYPYCRRRSRKLPRIPRYRLRLLMLLLVLSMLMTLMLRLLRLLKTPHQRSP